MKIMCCLISDTHHLPSSQTYETCDLFWFSVAKPCSTTIVFGFVTTPQFVWFSADPSARHPTTRGTSAPAKADRGH